MSMIPVAVCGLGKGGGGGGITRFTLYSSDFPSSTNKIDIIGDGDITIRNLATRDASARKIIVKDYQTGSVRTEVQINSEVTIALNGGVTIGQTTGGYTVTGEYEFL